MQARENSAIQARCTARGRGISNPCTGQKLAVGLYKRLNAITLSAAPWAETNDPLQLHKRSFFERGHPRR